MAYIASVMSGPGTVSHTSDFAQMRCGRVDGKPDQKLAAFADAAKQAGVDISITDTVEADRWKKFVFLVGLSGMTGATREPLGKILADPDTRAMFSAVMQEVVTVGRTKGVALPEDFVEDRMKFAATTPPGFKASLLHDLERGNRLEIDWLAGRVVALGRELGVPTPMNAAVYAVLKLHRMGRG
jgi:2-dehydropantoate 2-reductase